MIEVYVRHDKYTTVVQELRYLGELLGLELSHIFKDALSEDDVEALIAELNRRLNEIEFDQIRRWVMYGYIDSVVLDIRLKERRQGCGPTANIEQRAPFTLC
jgi:hypothetical protein